jgi:hypothetical protein
MPADNERFWRKRGSNSPESLCGFSSFSPVRAAVEAPPAPSRHHVVGNAARVLWEKYPSRKKETGRLDIRIFLFVIEKNVLPLWSYFTCKNDGSIS